VAVLNLSVLGRVYEIGCDDSQTDEVRQRCAEVDERAQRLARNVGTQPEARMLVMVALMIADELSEAKAALAEANAHVAAAAQGDGHLADGIVQITRRIEAIAERLERS